MAIVSWLFFVTLTMGLLKPFIDKLLKASNNLESVAIQAVRQNEGFILDLLKDKQLGEGEDSFGKIVGTYKESTINTWVPKDPPRTRKSIGQPYNFDWHGTFKDTMRVVANDDGYTIESATKRALEAIYNTKLTKLTKEHSDIIDKKIIIPALYEHIFSVGV